jgi:hypothetical protein
VLIRGERLPAFYSDELQDVTGLQGKHIIQGLEFDQQVVRFKIGFKADNLLF